MHRCGSVPSKFHFFCASHFSFSSGKLSQQIPSPPQVQRFFETRHPGHYKIFNLCSERGYELKNFFPDTERFPFRDHNPCPLDMIAQLCASVDAFLAAHPDNVVALHCKAGKGRTGLMISAYLLHSGVCATAHEALELFAERRTYNKKGVTIPSQIRYVHYFEQELLRGPAPVHTFQVTHVRFVTVPNFDVAGGCDPYFTVSVSNTDLDSVKVYDQRLHVPKKHIRKFKEKECVPLFVPCACVSSLFSQAIVAVGAWCCASQSFCHH